MINNNKNNSIFWQIIGFASIFAVIWYVVDNFLNKKKSSSTMDDYQNLNSDWGKLYQDFGNSTRKLV
ncbi:MAG: hypothetical protein EAZ27_02120 [Cytophagales bacterium]|nr:MAG: hypothetical protein EAZ27_02120 [Cytophagales bacterium]